MVERREAISWRCRSCARLRYSSEGGYLRPACGRLEQLGALLRASWGNLPRPASWLPYVLPSIDDPRLDELLGYSRYPRPSSDRGLVDSTSTSTSRSENPNWAVESSISSPSASFFTSWPLQPGMPHTHLLSSRSVNFVKVFIVCAETMSVQRAS